jgi:hypothetical protein
MAVRELDVAANSVIRAVDGGCTLSHCSLEYATATDYRTPQGRIIAIQWCGNVK